MDHGWTETLTLKQAVLKCSTEECLGLELVLDEWHDGFPMGDYTAHVFSSCTSETRASQEGAKTIWKNILLNAEDEQVTQGFEKLNVAFNAYFNMQDMPDGWMLVTPNDLFEENDEASDDGHVHGWYCKPFMSYQGGQINGCSGTEEGCAAGDTWVHIGAVWSGWLCPPTRIDGTLDSHFTL